MALPIIPTIKFTLPLPLSKKTIEYRPYNLADEKIILSANSAKNNDPEFYVNNIVDVIKRSVLTESVDVMTLPSVEVDLILAVMRGKSSGEVIEASYKDDEGKKHDIFFNIDDFEVFVPEDHQYTIMLTDEVGIQLKDLTFGQKVNHSSKKFKNRAETDIIFDTIIDSVEKVFDADKVYIAGEDFTREQIEEFLMQLQGKSEALYKFIATTPRIEVNATLADTHEKIRLRGDQVDFLG